MNKFTLSGANKDMKLIITFFIFVMALSYLIALVNVYDKTHFTLSGTAANYAGNEEEMIFEKGFSEMIEITHPHLLGMAMMFVLLCTIFSFSSASQLLKKIIVFLSFGSIIIDLGSAWLIRYVSTQFAILMVIAGMLMGISFLFLFLVPLKDIWLPKKSS
jgi:hypothetical protein